MGNGKDIENSCAQTISKAKAKKNEANEDEETCTYCTSGDTVCTTDKNIQSYFSFTIEVYSSVTNENKGKPLWSKGRTNPPPPLQLRRNPSFSHRM